MKSGQQIYDDAKRRVKQVTPAEAMALHQGGQHVFLDVRDQVEVNLGRIPGAVHVSRGTLEGKVEAAVPRDAKVVIYCASGNRSAMAALTLQEMGYGDVCSLSAGFRGWAEAGGEVQD